MIVISYNGTNVKNLFAAAEKECDTIIGSISVKCEKKEKEKLNFCRVVRIERRVKIEDVGKNKYRHRNKCGINIDTQCNG